jgi:hypothetical protein
MTPDFENMNETDVREIIVRPLLARLGYVHGTLNNIRTEVPLRYDRAFLGRKDPKKDPPLAGRADYICEVISYGRWTVEVKAPGHDLVQDDVEQAHTYSAHPEIGASHFLVTNGRDFRLYATGQLSEPILAWRFDQIDVRLMNIFNVVGPSAVKQRTQRNRADPHKPLGAGLPSRLRIVGGEVRYGKHRANHPLFETHTLEGTIGAITGGMVERSDDGRLIAQVRMLSPFQQLAELNRLAGFSDDYDFFSADEFVSTDIEQPTIFQNVIEGRLAPGTRAALGMGLPEIPLPFGFQCTVYTEATGFISNPNTFEGVLSFDYTYQIQRGRGSGIPQLDAMFASLPATVSLSGEGEFKVTLAEF